MSGIEGGSLPRPALPPGSAAPAQGPAGAQGTSPATPPTAPTQGQPPQGQPPQGQPPQGQPPQGQAPSNPPQTGPSSAEQNTAAQQAQQQAVRAARGEADSRAFETRQADIRAAAVRAEGLAQLIAQGIARGTVVGQDARGQPVLNTPSGHLLLQEGPRIGAGGLALGQEVTLRLAPGAAAGPVTFTLVAGPGPGGQPGPAPLTVRVELLSMQALLRMGLLPAPAGAAPTDLSGPHRLTAILLSAATAPASGGSGAAGPSWPAGQAFNALVQLAPEGGTVLAGRVLGPGPSGGTLVQTAAGTFLLQTGQAWPSGLSVGITLGLAGTGLPGPGMAGAAGTGQAGGQHLLQGWPALEAAMAQVAAQHPGLAAHLRSAVLPGANSGFTAAFLAFLTAIRGGGLQSWLGAEALRALDRGPLGARLSEDLGLLGRMLDDRLEGDWRFLPLPYADGEKLRQILVYMRDRRDRGDGKDPGTRFVLALELSATGTMQIDGLVRGKRLDLALRTARPMPSAWQGDIRGLFEDAMAITGMTGRMVFQSGRDALLELPQPLAEKSAVSA